MSIVIDINDIKNNLSCFYTSKSKNITNVIPFDVNTFDDDFYSRLTENLKGFKNEIVSSGLAKESAKLSVDVIVPNRIIFHDIVKLPATNKKMIQSSLDTHIKNIFVDVENIVVNKDLVSIDKQFAVYVISGIRKKTISSISNALDAAGFSLGLIVPESACIESLFTSKASDIRKQNALLLAIEDEFAMFSLSYNGRTIGDYILPFGLNALSSTEVIAEDILFNHDTAQLLVINSTEKAKARKLTTFEEEDEEEQLAENSVPKEDEGEETPDTEDVEADLEVTEDTVSTVVAPKQKLFTRKIRKFPLYMQRPEPETEDGYKEENFRKFAKWALNILKNSESLDSIGTFAKVYVSLPPEYACCINKMNEEEEENKVKFELINIKDTDVENIFVQGRGFLQQTEKSNSFSTRDI